jgi:hypothetical protein
VCCAAAWLMALSQSWAPFCDCIRRCKLHCVFVSNAAMWWIWVQGAEPRRGGHHHLVYRVNRIRVKRGGVAVGLVAVPFTRWGAVRYCAAVPRSSYDSVWECGTDPGPHPRGSVPESDQARVIPRRRFDSKVLLNNPSDDQIPLDAPPCPCPWGPWRGSDRGGSCCPRARHMARHQLRDTRLRRH